MELGAFFRRRVSRHDPQHFLHGGTQADEHRAADNAVADVQLDEMRHAKKRGQVFAVQTVARVDLEAERVRLLRGADQTPHFTFALRHIGEVFRERTGVQFDELAANPRRRLDLTRIGRDEQDGLTRLK